MKSIIALLVLSISVCGQFRPMLGEVRPQGTRFTPRHSIAYESNGFDSVRRKKIEKTEKWLVRHGAEHMLGNFQILAWSVEDMPAWFDDGTDEIQRKWRDCGGVYALTVARNSVKRLRVTVEAAPFVVPEFSDPGKPFYASGERRGDSIRIVIAHLRTDAGGWLQTAPELFKWEYGNWLWAQVFASPSTISGEVGNRSPCQWKGN